MNNLQLKIILNGVDKATQPLRNAMSGAKGLAQQLKETKEKLNQLNSVQKNVDGFAKIKKQFEDAKKATKDLAIQLKQTETPTKALQKAFNKAKEDTKKLKDQLNPLRAELQKSGISTKNLAQYQISLKNQINNTNKSIEQQSERLKLLNQRQQKMNQIRAKYDTGMQRIAVMGGVGYGALSTGRTVARQMQNLLHVGYEFDASMSATQAVTRIDDKNDPRMLALRQQARTLPLSSKFTDSEVAQGQYFLGRTGYDADKILKAMPGMLNLAAAGDIDLGTTADIASNIQMAMGIPAEKMDHVADVLTAMFTRNNVDIPMLGESLKYSAGVGASFGQSLETISTLTAMMGNAGIQGSQAGTTLRQILVRLGTSNAVAKLGVKVADKNGNMRDVIDIMADISEATKGMGNVQRAAINKQIAGQIGLTGFEVLLGQSQTGALRKMRGEQGEYDGEAARVAQLKLDNLKGDMTMLHAAFENISVELFEKNNEWLRKAVQGFTHFLHSIGEFLKKHPALSKGLVMLGAGLAVVTTAFGGLAILLMSVFGPMLMTRFILSRVGLSLGGLFTKTSLAGSGFKAFGQTLLTLAASPFTKLKSSFKWLLQKTIATGAGFKTLGQSLIFLSKDPVGAIGAAFRGLGAIFLNVGRAFLLNPIGLVITGIVLAALLIRKYWEPISAFFIGFWEGLSTAIAPVIEKFSFLAPFFNEIGDGISSVINWFSDLFEPVKLTSEEFNKAKSSGMAFGELVGQAIMFPIKLFQQFAELVKNVWNLILSLPEKLTEIKATFSDIGTNIADGITGGLYSKRDEVGKAVSLFADDVKNWFKDGLDIHSPSRVFASYGAYTVEGYQLGIERNQIDALRSMSNFADKVSTTGSQINNDIVVDRYRPLVSNESSNELKSTIANLTDGVTSWVKDALNIQPIANYQFGIERNQDNVIQPRPNFTDKVKTTNPQIDRDIVVDQYRPFVNRESSNELKSAIFNLTDGVTSWVKDALNIQPIADYQLGIERNPDDPLRLMSSFADKVSTAGSQINGGIIVDQRQPISNSPNVVSQGASQYYITVHAAPGMSEQEIANKVAQELDKRERQQAARYRSSLRDID